MLWICTWESFIFSGSPLGSELGDLEVSEAKLKTRDVLSGLRRNFIVKTKKQGYVYLTLRRGKEMVLKVGWELVSSCTPLPEAEGVLLGGCELIICW